MMRKLALMFALLAIVLAPASCKKECDSCSGDKPKSSAAAASQETKAETKADAAVKTDVKKDSAAPCKECSTGAEKSGKCEACEKKADSKSADTKAEKK